MPDLLVPLYKLPPRETGAASVRDAGVIIRRANPFEQTPVADFIRTHFTLGWAEETAVTFARQPVTNFIAIEDKKILGFAAFESTRKAFFGPTGVDPAAPGAGHRQGAADRVALGPARPGLRLRHHRRGGAGRLLQKAVGATRHPRQLAGRLRDLLR